MKTRGDKLYEDVQVMIQSIRDDLLTLENLVQQMTENYIEEGVDSELRGSSLAE